jgi:hypothetical protein
MARPDRQVKRTRPNAAAPGVLSSSKAGGLSRCGCRLYRPVTGRVALAEGERGRVHARERSSDERCSGLRRDRRAYARSCAGLRGDSDVTHDPITQASSRPFVYQVDGGDREPEGRTDHAAFAGGAVTPKRTAPSRPLAEHCEERQAGERKCSAGERVPSAAISNDARVWREIVEREATRQPERRRWLGDGRKRPSYPSPPSDSAGSK